jgi:ATP-dependent Clp protease adapter protein ClpS
MVSRFATLLTSVLFSILVGGGWAWSTPPQAAALFRIRSNVAADRAPLVRLNAGPATIDAPTKEKVKKDVKKEAEKKSTNKKRGGFAVRLFNDPMNKREFVAMCLCQIAGLSDGQAYSVMMAAHTNGLAVIGRYDFERAELYRNSLVEQGLMCDMVEVDED